ncbi:MAG: NrsF family protein [Filomicrobium sp.]
MKTDALISALTADGKKRSPAPHVLITAVAIGTIVSVIALLATIGVRDDLAAALLTWRFDVKLVVIALALVIAVCDAFRLIRPTGRSLLASFNTLPLAVLAVAMITELVLSPVSTWAPKLIGTNALLCLVVIPLLSLPVLIALLIAMRHGAPSSAISAGASAGRLAACISAFLYGLHCFDDSPLFVAVWYPLAALPVVAAAAFAGRLTLRW